MCAALSYLTLLAYYMTVEIYSFFSWGSVEKAGHAVKKISCDMLD